MGLNNGNQMRQVSFTIHYASHLYPCEIWNCVENGIKKSFSHIFERKYELLDMHCKRGSRKFRVANFSFCKA